MIGGTQLAVDQMILSPNKCFKLLMQADNNLVMYQIKDQKPLWASDTLNKGSRVAKMQPDGNFVLYDANNLAKWATATEGHPGAIVTLLDAGNLVVYRSTTNNTILWDSKTSGSC